MKIAEYLVQNLGRNIKFLPFFIGHQFYVQFKLKIFKIKEKLTSDNSLNLQWDV